MKEHPRQDTMALAALAFLYVVFIARSWLAWGHLDADFGREMYVPLRLADGDVIYRDVRYPYGPLSPYVHALAYTVWKPHLNVLYASGLVSTGAILALLYAIARRFTVQLVAAMATGFAFLELMTFPAHTSSFSYVFPYAFPAVHGLAFLLLALVGCLLLVETGAPRHGFVAGLGIGLALLTKQESGATGLVLGFMTIAGLWAVRKATGRAILALTIPALVVPAIGYGLLATQMPPANILRNGLFDDTYFGWRLSHLILGFRPGASWGEIIAVLGRRHLASANLLGAVVAFAATLAFLAGRRRETSDGSRRWPVVLLLIVALLGLIAIAAASGISVRIRYFALPGLALGTFALSCVWLARDLVAGGTVRPQAVQVWIAAAAVLAMLARAPARLGPGNYANFALPLAIVMLVVAASEVLPKAFCRFGVSERSGRGAVLVAVAILGLVLVVDRDPPWTNRTQALRTPRGALLFHPADPAVPGFRGALDRILDETEPGDTILAVPAETSLYFLSERDTSLYETSLIAVLRTEPEEDHYLRQLEADPPRLVFVSDRSQREYGRPQFGVHYATRVARWIERRYTPGETIGVVPKIRVWRPGGAGSEAAPVSGAGGAERGGEEVRFPRG